MLDVWRVTADLGDRRDARRLAALASHRDVHAPDRYTVAGYASSEEELAVVRAEIEGVLADEGVPATLLVSRWNPGTEEWQDPSLPIQEPERETLWFELDDLRWEVRARLSGMVEARYVQRYLIERHVPALGRGWRGVWAWARTAQGARRFESWIRNIAPDARTEIRKLTGFRRWLLKQGLLGNYAAEGRVGFGEGSGWGGGGNGGAGNGGNGGGG